MMGPVARACIRRIDIDRAKAAPGVVAVVTGADILEDVAPTPPRYATGRLPCPIELRCLAVSDVTYVGQPLCAVVATSQAEAEAAAEYVTLSLEPLPAVLDVTDAIQTGTAISQPGWNTNVVARDRIVRGDAAAAFEASRYRVSGSLAFSPSTTAPIEPRCYIANWDRRNERLTVHGSFQMPHLSRWMIAGALKLRESQVHVVAPAIGGTFGLKMVGHPEEVLVAVLARRLGRAVAFLESRAECFLAPAREQAHHFEIAADATGRITAFRDAMIADIGVLGAGGGWLMAMVAPTVFPTVYAIDNIEVTSAVVATNKAPWQGSRGYGKEVSNAVMERAIDLLAMEMKIDPLVLRSKNLRQPKELPHRLPAGLTIDSGNYPAAARQLEALFDEKEWKTKKARQRATERWRLGIGYAFDLTPEGASFPGTIPTGVETSTVRIEPSGEVQVLTSVTTPGSGNETGIAQLVASALGLHPSDIAVIQGDTDAAPFGGGNMSSRSLMFGGVAAYQAACELRDRIAVCAGEMLSVDPGSFVFEEGRIRSLLGNQPHVSFVDAVLTIYSHAYSIARNVPLPLQVARSFRSENLRHTPDENGRLSSYPSFTYSAHASVVEVDTGTGFVRVLDHACVHDCGIVVNPGLVDGQVRGAIAMGLGAGLWEALRFDQAGGLTTNRFKGFLMPRANDLPEIRLGHLCTPSPFNPLGVKGAAESGLGGALAAVTNAVSNASGPAGARLARVPMTAPDIMRALSEEGAR